MKSVLIVLAFLLPQIATMVKQSGFTDPVESDADDPAIWIHPKDPAKSIIFGTDKIKEKGGVYAFDLNGKTIQRIGNLNRPNNCDVEYDLGGLDILAVTERLEHRLRIFSIDRESGKLSDITGNAQVFESETESAMREPMGIGMYKDPQTGRVFAMLSRSKGSASAYLSQYELQIRDGKVDAKFVRAFGKFSGKKEIESVFVDDELGNIYYSDETYGTRKYSISNLDLELLPPNTRDFKGDQEGIALYATGKGTGYIVCTDQVAGDSVYHVFDRVTNQPLGSFHAGLDDTDGVEVVSANLGEKFPVGAFLAMNSKDKNFAILDWRNINLALKLPTAK